MDNSDLMNEKFGAHYVNINKKKLLSNWIKDELVNFERRQDESLKNLDLQRPVPYTEMDAST
jgi:hypothetical protein